MLFLAEVDLSEVNIVGYFHTEVPAGSNNINYAENTMFIRGYLNNPALFLILITESVTAVGGSYLSDKWLAKFTIHHSVKFISNNSKIN